MKSFWPIRSSRLKAPAIYSGEWNGVVGPATESVASMVRSYLHLDAIIRDEITDATEEGETYTGEEPLIMRGSRVVPI